MALIYGRKFTFLVSNDNDYYHPRWHVEEIIEPIPKNHLPWLILKHSPKWIYEYVLHIHYNQSDTSKIHIWSRHPSTSKKYSMVSHFLQDKIQNPEIRLKYCMATFWVTLPLAASALAIRASFPFYQDTSGLGAFAQVTFLPGMLLISSFLSS